MTPAHMTPAHMNMTPAHMNMTPAHLSAWGNDTHHTLVPYAVSTKSSPFCYLMMALLNEQARDFFTSQVCNNTLVSKFTHFTPEIVLYFHCIQLQI